jgi:hypothetical protein
MPWIGVAVASDTTQVRSGSMLRKPSYQYNYALRYALERVSRLAASFSEPVEVVIEKRRNFDLADFQRYMKLLKSRGDQNFDWNFFSPEDIRVEEKTTCTELCVADALAHGLFRAVEPDRKWKTLEPTYFQALRPKLWSKQGQLLGTGLTMMPKSAFGTFLQEYEWLQEEMK